MYTTLSDLRSDLLKQARVSSTNVVTSTTEIDRAINKAILDVSHNYPWVWRQHFVTIQTVAPYVTGTVTMSAASRNVTFSGSTWNTNWTGYWLQLDNEQEWYKVAVFASTSTLVLEQPYHGTQTGSGKTYKLIKRIYTLPSIVDDMAESLMLPQLIRPLVYTSKTAFDREYSLHLTGNIYNWTKWGLQYAQRVYNTGTVAGTTGTYALTGTATAWLGNILEGDQITISGTNYNVLSVNSDTSITLNQLLQTSPSGTSYSAMSLGACNIEFGFLPNDVYNIEIPCLKRVFKVIDANDIIPVPSQFMEVIRHKALAEILYMQDSQKAQVYDSKANEAIQSMINDFALGLESRPSVERE